MAKETKLTESVFINRTGQTMKITDVVTEKECWYVEKEKRWVLAHKAIQKIAALAGISSNYIVDESPSIQPSYKNELEHIVRVTIKCLAKPKKGRKGCIHNEDENTCTVTGEANKLNTPVRGRGYLRKMAEKRAYDIAVLEHLYLYDTTFSEEESETMIGKTVSGYQSVEISNVDLEALTAEINMLVACDTKEKLAEAEKTIAANTKVQKYTAAQIRYLEQLTADRRVSVIGLTETDDKPF